MGYRKPHKSVSVPITLDWKLFEDICFCWTRGSWKKKTSLCKQVREPFTNPNYSEKFGFILTNLSTLATFFMSSTNWPGARFSKVPITFRARKAICKTANRLFWKVDLLTCFQGKKKKNDFEVWQHKSSPFLRYKENCDTRKWPVKSRNFRETGPSSQLSGFIA